MALGLAALVAGDPDTAVRHLDQASREATPSAKPMQTRLHFDLARAFLAHRAAGDWATATWHLEQAVETAELLGMNRLAARAQDLLDGLNP